jgi:hypothetical protein
MRQLLVTASVVPSSPILVTLMKEALSSSETLVLIRATRRNIPEDAILHNHQSENLKSYMPDQLRRDTTCTSVSPAVKYYTVTFIQHIPITASQFRLPSYLGSLTKVARMKSLALEDTPSNSSSGKLRQHWEMLQNVSCLLSPANGE